MAEHSDLYNEMLAKFGAAGMAKNVTMGQACDMIGAVQAGAIKALEVHRQATEAIAQRLILIERAAGYEVTGTDRAGKPRLKMVPRRSAA